MTRADPNPFPSTELASRYQSQYDRKGRHASLLEKTLLGTLPDDFGQVRTVLEIGFGTRHFIRWLEFRGLTLTGADPSLPALREPLRIGMSRIVAAGGGSLPFGGRSFDVAALATVSNACPLSPLSIDNERLMNQQEKTDGFEGMAFPPRTEPAHRCRTHLLGREHGNRR